MSVDIIHDFVRYQIEWLTSHNDLEFEPLIESALVRMLKDTGERFIDEWTAENSQTDHIADVSKKVERTDESAQNVQNEDLISRKAAIEATIGMIDRFERILADIRESKGDDSVCGMCEYDGAYIGQSGDWCNECPGFDKNDCFKLSDRCRKRWMGDITLPSAQPDRDVIDDCLHHIYKNISVHTATGGVIAIRYYMEKLYEEIYGEGEKPWWMT